jgi:hypothetical protein
VRIYVAGKFERVHDVRAVQEILRANGHTITFDWTRDDLGFTSAQAMRDYMGVFKADALVIVAGEDLPYKGTYVEFGMALMKGIPIYILGKGMDGCLFITMPQVHRGIDELIVLSVNSASHQSS